VTYSDVLGGYVGVSNIDADPLFVNVSEGDYHLSEGSPCIDAGDPTSPLDPDSTRADMGAFYYNQMPQAVKPDPSISKLEFALYHAYPNPFNPTTVISYELRVSSCVSLTIYDVQGREVVRLIEGWQDVGSHEVTFDASGLTSAVYLYRLDAGEFTAQRKLVYLK